MTSKRIHPEDRGHDAVGGIRNEGKDNHQHGKRRGGVAHSPMRSTAVTGPHPAFDTKHKHGR